MPHRHRRPATLSLTLAALCCAGCQTTSILVVSGLALRKQPLAIAIVVDPAPTTAIAPFNPFNRYLPMQLAMADELRQPVSVDNCFAFQAGQGLTSGWYALAIVTPSQYAALPPDSRTRVLAVAADRRGRAVRAGLLIVPEQSAIRTIGDLRGKVVAFGPTGDSLTHHAALQLLSENGVAREDLALELLPVPGSLKHLPNNKAVAQSVLSNASAAGFVDESAWDEMPESGSDARNPARSQFRIIGQTVALPVELVVASPKLDAATAERIGQFLLRAGKRKPDMVRALDFSGFAEPNAEMLAACARLKADSGASHRGGAREPDDASPTTAQARRAP